MWVVCGLFVLICLFPLYILPVMASYSTEQLLISLPFFFSDYFLTNTRRLLESGFQQAYLNSIFVSAVSIVFSSMFSALLAYAVTKYRFRGRRLLENMVLLTMMVPGQISTIGYILEMRKLGFVNTLWPLVFVWLAHPLTAYFMIQFMKNSVPMEIIESGRIDGCSEPRIFVSLVFPFIFPAISSVGILLFLWSWNSYTLPMLSINVKAQYTIPLFVANLISEFRIDMGAQLAGLTWAIFPILILFVIFSKSFIKGISAGAVKG